MNRSLTASLAALAIAASSLALVPPAFADTATPPPSRAITNESSIISDTLPLTTEITLSQFSDERITLLQRFTASDSGLLKVTLTGSLSGEVAATADLFSDSAFPVDPEPYFMGGPSSAIDPYVRGEGSPEVLGSAPVVGTPQGAQALITSALIEPGKSYWVGLRFPPGANMTFVLGSVTGGDVGFLYLDPAGGEPQQNNFWPNDGNNPLMRLESVNPVTSVSYGSGPTNLGDDGTWFSAADLDAVDDTLTVTPTCLVECDSFTITPNQADTDPQSFTVPVSVNGTSMDVSVEYRLDAKKPVITADIDSVRATDVYVMVTCRDEGVGLVYDEASAMCDRGSVTLERRELAYVETLEVKDKLGQIGTTWVTVPGTKTFPPAITITGVVDGKTYPYGTVLTPSCTAQSTVPALSPRGVTRAKGSVPTCTGTTTSVRRSDGSVAFTYTARGIDTHELAGTATKTVRWFVAAKPVSKPVAKPSLRLTGFGTQFKDGVPVVKLGKVYSTKASLTLNGKPMKSKPVWLMSVPTNKQGTTGKPTKASPVPFVATDTPGVWAKGTSFGATGYRKFGVKLPNGNVFYRVVLVVR